MLRPLLLVVGCSSVYAPLNINDDSGMRFNSSATTGIGGNRNADLSTIPDSGLPSVPSGRIVAHSGPPSSTSASFAASGCTASTVSSCLFLDCPPSDMASATQLPNAGTIRVTTSLVDVVLTPLVDGSYPTKTSPSLLWPSAGAPVMVSGSGGDLAAFSQTLDGPSAVTIVDPLFASGISLSRSADFNIAWTGTTTGLVTVDLTAGNQQLECAYLVSGGSGIVPAKALSMLSAGSGMLDIVVADSQAADGTILVRAEVPAQDSNGNAFSTTVTVK
jgi:hypothetical protein